VLERVDSTCISFIGKFERAIAEATGALHAISVSNGTVSTLRRPGLVWAYPPDGRQPCVQLVPRRGRHVPKTAREAQIVR
jgi:hypothetical protein